MEEWVAIEDYVGLYEVSNMGRVRSVARKITYSDNGSSAGTQGIYNCEIQTRTVVV